LEGGLSRGPPSGTLFAIFLNREFTLLEPAAFDRPFRQPKPRSHGILPATVRDLDARHLVLKDAPGFPQGMLRYGGLDSGKLD
jgi:hypothetical protein